MKKKFTLKSLKMMGRILLLTIICSACSSKHNNKNDNVEQISVLDENMITGFAGNMKIYLRANDIHNFDEMNLDQMAVQCYKIFAKNINTGYTAQCDSVFAYKNEMPIPNYLSAVDVNFLTGPNGFMAYLFMRLKTTKDNKKMIAEIHNLQILIGIMKGYPYYMNDSNVKTDRRWFEGFQWNFESFIEKEKEKNPELNSILQSITPSGSYKY